MLPRGENMCRRFNCCIFNHPIPIFCPQINLACQDGNQIINPILNDDFGFFNNLLGGVVTPQAIIPVGFVQGRGTGILPSTTTAGAVTLQSGTYQITYSAGATVPASGSVSIKLTLNGVDVSGSVVSGTQTAGNVITLGRTITLTVPQTSTLALVNNSAENVTFADASLFIRQI